MRDKKTQALFDSVRYEHASGTRELKFMENDNLIVLVSKLLSCFLRSCELLHRFRKQLLQKSKASAKLKKNKVNTPSSNYQLVVAVFLFCANGFHCLSNNCVW